MFVLYRKQGAALVRALVQLALESRRGRFEEVRPPTLVRTDTMTVSPPGIFQSCGLTGTAYHLDRDDLSAIPTAEVPLTSLAHDEILDEGQLPMRLMAHTSCFRRAKPARGS